MVNLLSFFQKKPSERKIKPVVLLILDGWGVAPASAGNPMEQAKIQNMVNIRANHPNSLLVASGESVGLPANEVGNTEVGHLTIGAGRVIYQDLKRINNSLFDKSYYTNRAFLDTLRHALKNKSKLHLVGLIGSGNVHSSLDHLFALMNFCKYNNFDKKVYLHLFTDGRDSPPQEGLDIVSRVELKIHALQLGKIASISGRYYAMDRDGRWDRTEKAYRAIVEGVGPTANSAREALQSSYKQNITDEFVVPTILAPEGLIDNGDAVIFYNFRIDRPRQLTMAFVLPNFESLKSFEFGYISDIEKEKTISFDKTFERKKILQNIFFTTMTQYQRDLPVNSIAFPSSIVKSSLAEVISKAGLAQMHMSESEKEKFVTYYFDGMNETSFLGEDIKIVPSPKVATYDLKPEMSISALISEFKRQMLRDIYHLFVINVANPDMVAHTGNIKATIAALEASDRAIGEITKEVLAVGGTLVVTADHGNAEELISYPAKSFFFTTHKGSVNTDHSNNPVPLIIISNQMTRANIAMSDGTLADIAPTILGIMNIEKPAEMSGKNLITKK